jgi:putative endonuclease
VEVKYRRKKQTGYPEEAVDYRKQYKICRVADYYMISRRNSPTGNVRFDVVAILGDAIHLYRNAFAYIVQ